MHIFNSVTSTTQTPADVKEDETGENSHHDNGCHQLLVESSLRLRVMVLPARQKKQVHQKEGNQLPYNRPHHQRVVSLKTFLD